MLEINLITVIYKRMGKFWYITQSLFHSIQYLSQYNKVKGTFCLKGTTFVYVLSSDWFATHFIFIYDFIVIWNMLLNVFLQ
jgi:hypothetical protein